VALREHFVAAAWACELLCFELPLDRTKAEGLEKEESVFLSLIIAQLSFNYRNDDAKSLKCLCQNISFGHSLEWCRSHLTLLLSFDTQMVELQTKNN
jgi:hypothetical protein